MVVFFHVQLPILIHCALSGQELLFRGALQPLFGSNLSSALVVALVFGALHLGSGRKYSFAVWYLSSQVKPLTAMALTFFEYIFLSPLYITSVTT